VRFNALYSLLLLNLQKKMKQEEENIIEVRHNYSSNGVIESTDYVVNGELVEGFYSLDSLRSTLENIFKFKNIVVKKYGKLSI
jgi:hypothetical protein